MVASTALYDRLMEVKNPSLVLDGSFLHGSELERMNKRS